MKSTDLPELVGTPFAENGIKTAISQNTSPGTNAASYNDGFPAITMTELNNGGLPPRGSDFNQILYELAKSIQWAGTGALYKFSADFATKIGGYPKGSKVIGSDGNVYECLTDDNMNDPVGGAGWVNNGEDKNTRELWRRSLAEIGLTLVDGSFQGGAVVNSETDAVWDIGGAQCYTWTGDFPHTAESEPGEGWVSVNIESLRREITSLLGASIVMTKDGRTVQQRLDSIPDEVDAAGTAKLEVAVHNESGLAHEDIRAEISAHMDDPSAHQPLRAAVAAEADRAEAAAEKAESIVDTRGTYPDIASGLAATDEGEYFRVPQGVGNDISFIYYRNTSGEAVPVASQVGDGVISSINSGMNELASGLAGLSSAVDILAEVSVTTEANMKEVSSGMEDNTLKVAQLESISAERKDNASDLLTAMLVLNASVQVNNLGSSNALSGLLTAISSLSHSLCDVSEFNPTAEEQLQSLQLAYSASRTLLALNGTDPSAGGAGNSIVPAALPGLYILPEPEGLISINVNIPRVPATKAEGKVDGSVTVFAGGATLTLFCKVSVQGSSSSVYPKKNLNVEFYNDADYSSTVKVKIGDVLPHDEWVYKANWIDFTHCRNLTSYKLWAKMVGARKGYPRSEVDQSYIGLTGVDAISTGATGHPTGYPCVMNVNGEFYGIGDLMIGKKRGNYNIPKNSPKKILIDTGTWFDVRTFPDPSAYEIKAPSAPTAETDQALADWVAFCALPDAEFNAAIETKMDKTNIIDFILLVQFIGATDLISGSNIKNVQMLTYDGVKWFFMPYDLDTTYGLSWDGKEIRPTTGIDLFSGEFWRRVTSKYSTDINNRYRELRQLNIFTVASIYNISNSLIRQYTKDMFEAESEKWEIPSLNISTQSQIYSWAGQRLAYLDTKYNYSPN